MSFYNKNINKIIYEVKMKKFVICLTVSMLTVLSANAHIDNQYMTTSQYMLNSGYSSEMAKYAEMSTRDHFAPTDDIHPVKSPKSFFKDVWQKVDPTAFPDHNNTWHAIKMNTGFSDL